ncbi:MAG: C13 family peptidase [Steroidobacteraceae bacterium]
MDSLSISTRLDVSDWRAYQRACALRLQQVSQSGAHAWRFYAVMLLVAFLVAGVVRSGVPLQVPSFMLGGVLFCGLIWFRSFLLRRNVVPDANGAFLSPQTLELAPEGLHSVRSETRSFTSWSLVESISVTPDHIFVWIDRFNAHVVPLRDLPDGVTAEQLRIWLEARLAQVVRRPVRTANAEPRKLIVHWPMALLNLLGLRRTDLPPRANVRTVAALVGIALSVWAVIDWLRNQPDPDFYIYALPSIGWYLLLLLALAAVFTFRSFPQPRFSSVLALVLAITSLSLVAAYLIDRYTTGILTAVAIIVACLYCGFCAWRGLESLTGRGQPNALASGALLVLLAGWATTGLYVEPSLWVAPEGEAEAQYQTNWQQAESVLFSQSNRIDAAIDAMVPVEGDAPAAFFLGFAGMGEQRVFAEEIKLAAGVMGTRYGSADRSLLLVNDQRDLESQPLASPTALRYALQGIAGQMNLERDVLFLSLSSHGAKDATIAVSNGGLMLQDLSADELAAALDDAGIKWRVIVVSACYSGAFIEPLRNPQTIVITASSADRTSFGCADDRDLTYFGEAFYRDALPKATSLRNAYEIARDAIKKREQEEGITASRPQAFFGEEIEASVEKLAKAVEQ